MNDQESIKKLIDSNLMMTARIAALEIFARELAIKAMGDNVETSDFCKTIDREFQKKLKEIEGFNPRDYTN